MSKGGGDHTDYVAFLRRVLRALSRRVGDADPEDLAEMVAVRAFYRWGLATGRTLVDPSESLPHVTPGPARPRPAPEAAYRAALGRARPRERLMLRLAAECGLRRAEIAGIHSRDPG